MPNVHRFEPIDLIAAMAYGFSTRTEQFMRRLLSAFIVALTALAAPGSSHAA
jgi:hypothetical protein